MNRDKFYYGDGHYKVVSFLVEETGTAVEYWKHGSKHEEAREHFTKLIESKENAIHCDVRISNKEVPDITDEYLKAKVDTLSSEEIDSLISYCFKAFQVAKDRELNTEPEFTGSILL